MRLADFFRTYRGGIGLALGLSVVENVAWIAEPALFGPVLDALISVAAKEPHVSAARPLAIWITVFLVNSITGTVRRSVDPRIYLRIYADIAARVVEIARDRKLPVSVAAARAELSREFITFLEYRVPEILEQAIAITGALIGLAFFDYRIALTCAVVLAPVMVIERVYSGRVLSLQKDVHDRLETAFDRFKGLDPEEVRSYYMGVAGPQRRIANWGAASFGLMRLVLLAVFLVVLWVSTALDDFTTGQLYSIVAYLWTFVTSTEYLPELLESWTAIRDLSRRLRQEA
jgi:ABC-type multidrug transport system fused ATPase/permease subunit